MPEPSNGPIPQSLYTPIAIVIAGAFVALAMLYGGTGTGTGATNTGTNNGTAPVVDSSKVSTKDDPFIGNPNAPLTIIYFFDYQCPFCKQVETTALPDVLKNYVATGKVKLVYKDFQFLGDDSYNAALAARAVWELAPEKFEVWHDAVFAKQDAENGGWGSQADILAVTKSVGIDSDKVNQLVTKNATVYRQEIDADRAEGQNLGVTGTPGFIIGKQVLAGAQPYAAFESAIEAALK